MSILTLPFMTYLAISSYIYEGYFGIPATSYSFILGITIILGATGMAILQGAGKRIGIRAEGLIILALILASGIFRFLFGYLSAIACFLCYTPCVIAAITTRPYGFNILLQ